VPGGEYIVEFVTHGQCKSRQVLAHYCKGPLFRRLGLELGIGLVGLSLGLGFVGLRC